MLVIHWHLAQDDVLRQHLVHQQFWLFILFIIVLVHHVVVVQEWKEVIRIVQVQLLLLVWLVLWLVVHILPDVIVRLVPLHLCLGFSPLGISVDDQLFAMLIGPEVVDLLHLSPSILWNCLADDYWNNGNQNLCFGCYFLAAYLRWSLSLTFQFLGHLPTSDSRLHHHFYLPPF